MTSPAESEVDLERLATIREVMDIELSELVGGMLVSMAEAIGETEGCARLTALR